ncbi:MAG: DEAD/DEAH box helicase [Betaproteobacteria bacterium]|nr:DEAD/DEAH box helicase [Betaproteobacteria bacterium]
MTNFDSLGLNPSILRAVAERGYVTPTPIQAKAIPAILAGKDIMGGAQTGTGKTAGFTLPMLQRLLPHANSSPSPARHPVRALILTPTRELAMQVEESVRDYGKYTGLRATVVFGGMGMDAQEAALRAGVELLVATPGRLLDHLQQKTLNLNQVEIFVLDEADRMLDMGFIPDIKRIIALLPARRQNLLFSATFSPEIKKLADQLLNQPELIEVARRNTAAENVTQLAYVCRSDAKRALLERLLRDQGEEQALVFMRTKQGAGRLARQLEKAGFEATAIHGDKSQLARIEALDGFKEGKIRVLVATDVAARGLDIEELPLVFNFELPYVPEDYIHRIGRTGRAGASGIAISIVGPDEEKLLAEIERMLKRTLPRQPLPELTSESRPTRPARAAPSATPWAGVAPLRDKSHFDLNPDQHMVARSASARGGSALIAGAVELPPLPTRRGRQIPALLMKKPTPAAPAEPTATSAPESVAQGAPESTPEGA